jgi:hypothetical protein
VHTPQANKAFGSGIKSKAPNVAKIKETVPTTVVAKSWLIFIRPHNI